MTIERDEERRGQGSFIYTKEKSGFLNTYKILAYNVRYLKKLSIALNYNMANRKCVKYNLRFYCCFCS
jgi:hypothetical protein